MQATRIGIDASHIDVRVELTPGADIAPGLISSIDTNGNGWFDGREFNDFTHAVEQGLKVTLDGRAVPLTFQRWDIATIDELRQGTGSMRFQATVPTAGGPGHHALAFANEFAPAPSAFLVNALAPADARVQLGPPARDPRQRTFAIEYDVAGMPRAPWVTIGVAMIVALLAGRRRGRVRSE